MVLEIGSGSTKGIETMNPINAKSVQLTRAARCCDLVCIYLSESFDFLKSRYDSLKDLGMWQKKHHAKPENKHP